MATITLITKNTSVASKRPTSAQLITGELALNLESSDPGLYFEDSAGNIRKIGGSHYGATAPNSSAAGQTGNSVGELWYDSANSSLQVWDGTSWVDTDTGAVVSDERDKTNFGSVPHGLDFVNQLDPIAFQYKVDRETETPQGPVLYGFKAQDILALEGEDGAVIIDNGNPERLRYRAEALIPVLVNAIKEQQAIIDGLSARLDAAGI